MRYCMVFLTTVLLSCGTSSTEKPREYDSVRIDGTRLTDTLLVSDSVPPGITNPQPD